MMNGQTAGIMEILTGLLISVSPQWKEWNWLNGKKQTKGVCMGIRIKKTFLCILVVIFCIGFFSHLAYALREISGDYRKNIEEDIKKENIQKRTITENRKRKPQINKTVKKSSPVVKEQRSPSREIFGEKNKQKGKPTFYIFGGIFFILVIGAILIFVKKLKS